MSTRRFFGRHHDDHGSQQTQVIGAVFLIALGLVFLAQQAGILEASGNWWVIFLLIPGLGLIWNGLRARAEEHATTEQQAIEVGLGVILVILTAIFIFDPNWKFLGDTFRSSFWDRAWRFIVLGVGLILLAVSFLRRWAGLGVLGALVSVTGIVFIFDINWDYVWPLALIIPGAWMLLNALRHPGKSEA